MKTLNIKIVEQTSVHTHTGVQTIKRKLVASPVSIPVSRRIESDVDNNTWHEQLRADMLAIRDVGS